MYNGIIFKKTSLDLEWNPGSKIRTSILVLSSYQLG